MANWFLCRARYDKMQENGTVKKMNEPYLVDALSFTEAESRFIEEITPFISGEFTVTVAKRTKIAEIFNIGAERYWLVKVAFITIDERSGTEKRSISQILVGAMDFTNAIEEFNEGMKSTMADFEIVSLSETPIMDVYPAKLS
ncbi:MAG: DUF4494 domain-containing protein [Muribaculaceae bacterium]|nr:DUF4494 domain-containing protein [Muribaculaceae bacterium]